MDNGATACIIYNNLSGTIRMSVPEILGALAGNTANTPILRDIRL